jgi:3-hydroxyacyl-CoA dehydrogenase
MLSDSGDDLLPPPRVRRVAILGAGMMGTAIAAATLRGNLAVVLDDADPQALESAPQRIVAELRGAGVPPSEAENSVRRLVSIADGDAELSACDLVLESIVENLPAKQQLYARVEPRLAGGAILASNTSTIPIGRLAAKLTDPRRLVGLHFFHPVRARPLVEVVRGAQTCDRTIDGAVGYVRSIGRIPVVVGDGPGFLVNRLLFPYLAEALELLLDGATIGDIELAATEFGMGLGPLRLMDEIGLDTVVLGGRVLWEAFPDRIEPSPLLVSMYKAGRLGRKTGAGFFAYSSGSEATEAGHEDAGTVRLIADWARPPRSPSPDAITRRLLLPMVLEATRILDEGRVASPQTVDTAVVMGLGFPTSRGGLLRWADTLGAGRILSCLQELERLGARFRPTPLLCRMAAEQRPFYAADG